MAQIKLAELKHKIEVTDSLAKPVESGAEKLSRVSLFDTWAKLETANQYRLNGFKISIEDRATVTHLFTIRERCDYEIGCSNWIYRTYRDRDEWYKILASPIEIECGVHTYWRIPCALWVRDSLRIDEETQDVPCERIEPDGPSFDHRDMFC